MGCLTANTTYLVDAPPLKKRFPISCRVIISPHLHVEVGEYLFERLSHESLLPPLGLLHLLGRVAPPEDHRAVVDQVAQPLADHAAAVMTARRGEGKKR